MREFKITTGKTVHGGRVSRGRATWKGLVKKLSTFCPVDMTMGEYASLDVNAREKIKDSHGFYLGSIFNSRTRKKESLTAKTLITLDVDYLEDMFELECMLSAYSEYEFFAHTTLSHTQENPKLRIVFPVTRDMTPDEYEPVTRKVANWSDIDVVDAVSYRGAQLCFWPAQCADLPGTSWANSGEWIDPDKVLEEYSDWHDWGAWPKGEKENPIRKPGIISVDPRTKDGVVGAFCRVYGVEEAIAEFGLPYKETEVEGRYTPDGSTGGAGAIVYDNGLFLYSHHSHDVASDKNLNAYDLVRLCLFGQLDEGIGDAIEFHQLPSQAEMKSLALKDARVIAELNEAGDIDVIRPAGAAEGRGCDVDLGVCVDSPVLCDPCIDAGVLVDAEVEDVKEGGEEDVEGGGDVLRLSYAGLVEAIDGLDDVGMDDVRSLLSDVVAAKLDPLETDSVMKLLRDKSGRALRALTKQYKSISELARARKSNGKGGGDDPTLDAELTFIDAVLSDHYANGKHLKRIGNIFWQFDSGLWRRVISDEVVEGKVLITSRGYSEKHPESAKVLVEQLGESKNSTFLNQIWRSFIATLAVEDDSADPLGLMDRFKPPVFNCLNGEVWVTGETGAEFREHDPKNFFTSQIPVNWDEQAECPGWDKFCGTVFSGSGKHAGAMQRHLEEIIGYALQFRRNLKTWVLFHGPTNAGKSTVGRVMSDMLGTASVSESIGYYAKEYAHATSELVGKLLLIDEDFAKGGLLPDEFIKKISEEKSMKANPKGKNPFPFVCRALPLIISNHWPPVRDTTSAFCNRGLVIPFNTIPDELRSDKAMEHMLQNEKEGMLKRFIEGYQRLAKRGEWKHPKPCTKAWKEWTYNSNPVRVFVDDMLIKTDRKEEDFVKAHHLYIVYKNWHRDASSGGKMLGRNSFYQSVEPIIGGKRRDRCDGFVFDGWACRVEEDEF